MRVALDGGPCLSRRRNHGLRLLAQVLLPGCEALLLAYLVSCRHLESALAFLRSLRPGNFWLVLIGDVLLFDALEFDVPLVTFQIPVMYLRMAILDAPRVIDHLLSRVISGGARLIHWDTCRWLVNLRRRIFLHLLCDCLIQCQG